MANNPLLRRRNTQKKGNENRIITITQLFVNTSVNKCKNIHITLDEIFFFIESLALCLVCDGKRS